MNGVFHPHPSFTTRGLSATYSLSGNGSTELTLSYTGTDTTPYRVIGIVGYTTGNDNVYIRRIANVTPGSCDINIHNVGSSAQSNKTASVTLMLMNKEET